MKIVTGSQVIQEFLDVFQVPFVFGNPGTTETGILEAITHCKKTKYVLSLQESSVIGIASGYALITQKPAVVNIHTYPGLANSMCNMYNAYTSGIPLVVIAGQQNRKCLIHNPVLSGPLTRLAETATKYSYEVLSADDLAIALHRGYTQALIKPSAPTFLSIPMDILKETTKQAYFKRSDIHQDTIDVDGIATLCKALSHVPKNKLAFIVDYEAGSSNNINLIGAVASHFDADLYASPYHAHPVLNPLSPNFKKILPVTSAEIFDILEPYNTVVIFGAKLDTFLFTGKPAIPAAVNLIQVSSAEHLSFDYPCDLALLGDVDSVLLAIIEQLKIKIPSYSTPERKLVSQGLMSNFESSNLFTPIIIKILQYADHSSSLVTEGSSEDSLIQQIAAKFGFVNVYFSPSGGGLGWAMPLATGISLATSKHSLCFVGDGGSMYSIHAIWTAAKYRIPVIFICFINHEYKILKNLWCQFENTNPKDTQFIGLDLTDPKLDVLSIAKSFGAVISTIHKLEDVEHVLKKAYQHKGPSFIAVELSN